MPSEPTKLFLVSRKNDPQLLQRRTALRIIELIRSLKPGSAATRVSCVSRAVWLDGSLSVTPGL